MKTILRSLIYSLGVLFIAILINGKGFLNQDAQYTYENDYGRIDARIEGVNQGRVEVDGKGVKYYEPQWFKYENNQGNSLSFPVSYKSNHREIVLTPASSQLSDTSKLMIKFMGQDYRIDNKRVPAKVKYKNIKINGEKISDKVTVWHDKPFKYYLNNIKSGEEIKVSFDIYKPFSTSDINWAWILGFIVVVWLLTGIFLWKKDFFHKLFDRLDSVDLIATIVNTYKSIDSVYRKSFWIIFIIINVVFGFHTINFMWGNHEWGCGGLLDKLHYRHELAIGRYSNGIIRELLFDGRYLPIISNLIAFAMLAITAVLLAVYWKLPKKIYSIVLCGLILTIQPLTLSWLAYNFELPEFFIAPIYILIALLLSEYSSKISSKRKILIINLISIALINFALSTYPSTINTVFTIFIGKLFIVSLEWNGKIKEIYKLFSPYIYTIIDIIIAAVIFKCALYYLAEYGILRTDFYSIKPIAIEDVPSKILQSIDAAFRQMYNYSTQFMPNFITVIFGILLVGYLAVLVGTNKNNLSRKDLFTTKLFSIFLLLLTLISTKIAPMLSSENVLFIPRVDFYGLAYFRTFLVILWFSATNIQKQIAFVVSCILIWNFAIGDFHALRTWKLGFEAERMLWNRVLARMEINDNFVPSNQYDVMQIGPSFAMRKKYHKEKYSVYSRELVNSFNHDTVPFTAENFYYPTNFVRNKYISSRDYQPAIKDTLIKLYDAGVLDKAKAWPHKDSLIIHDDIILFVTDEKELHRVKNSIAQERLAQNKENK